jgi:hypothetical protein
MLTWFKTVSKLLLVVKIPSLGWLPARGFVLNYSFINTIINTLRAFKIQLFRCLWLGVGL